MDLASDILRLAEHVALVPGLSVACTLAIKIMTTVQISKKNTARLQFLAHSVAEHLVAISMHMQGRWDNISDQMKKQLDEYEAVLRSISKLVTKYTKASRVMAIVNAGERDSDIIQTERRLADVQRSMLVLLGLEASVAIHHLGTGVDQIRTTVDSQHPLWLETRDTLQQLQTSLTSTQRTALETQSVVSRLENANSQVVSLSSSDDVDVRSYTRRDLRLQRTIDSRSFNGGSGDEVTITLHVAQHRTNDQMVLVRNYEGTQSSKRHEVFSRDLAYHSNVWEPILLQLIGASMSTSSLPFQVYDAPEGHMEAFDTWLSRTIISDPVETICGLYSMKTSIKALLDFQTRRDVTCRLPFHDSVVNVRKNGNQLQWALIYIGEIWHGDRAVEKTQTSGTVHDQYQGLRLPYSVRRSDAPGWRIVEAFRQASRVWADDTHGRDLNTILNHGTQNIDLPTLGSVLFENEWLEIYAIHGSIPRIAALGLGDVGYTTGDGRFVVVSNLYSLLESVGGGALTWEAQPIQDTGPLSKDSVVVERSGKSYRRYDGRQCSWHNNSLSYVNLNERQAWKTFQEHACEIAAHHDLAESPHELKLFTRVYQYAYFSCQPVPGCKHDTVEADGQAGNALAEYSSLVDHETRSDRSSHADSSPDVERLETHNKIDAVTQSFPVTDSASGPSGQRSPPSAIRDQPLPNDRVQRSPPPYYVFEGDSVHVRASGVPELSPWVRPSFQPEPNWLAEDNPFWVVDETSLDKKILETKDGYELSEYLECEIDYLQLPPGVALPYIQEECKT